MKLRTFCHEQHWEENSGFTKDKLLGLFALFCRGFTTCIFITLETKVFCLSAELINSVRSPLTLCAISLPVWARTSFPGRRR